MKQSFMCSELDKELNSYDAIVIGGGLAGSEATLQLAKRGFKVLLFEQRPCSFPPAFKTDKLAELVCSNSLGGYQAHNAASILKEELKVLGSFLLEIALRTRIPAGRALTVDRTKFSSEVTRQVSEHPNVVLIRHEVKTLPLEFKGVIIVATGPLTSQALAEDIAKRIGVKWLYFFDAVSPIISADSINWDKVYFGARYNQGPATFVNCPLTKEEYERFWEELVEAEVVPLKEFESEKLFEACLPVEELAKRGRETLRYGPMRPVGLPDPRTGKEPYAVVQLRPENIHGGKPTMYNMVGFQTRLKWSEQRRVFRMIPGLEEAEFIRYGVMHRNIYVNSPAVLKPTLQFRSYPRVLLAGQIAGSEGYTESIALGLLAGINASLILRGKRPIILPRETLLGSLVTYITHTDPENFQPMNANLALLPEPEEFELSEEVRQLRRKIKKERNWNHKRELRRQLKKLKVQMLLERSLKVLRELMKEMEI